MNATMAFVILPSAAVQVGAALIELGRSRGDRSSIFGIPSVN